MDNKFEKNITNLQEELRFLEAHIVELNEALKPLEEARINIQKSVKELENKIEQGNIHRRRLRELLYYYNPNSIKMD